MRLRLRLTGDCAAAHRLACRLVPAQAQPTLQSLLVTENGEPLVTEQGEQLLAEPPHDQ